MDILIHEIGSNIYFAPGSAKLSPQARLLLTQWGRFFKIFAREKITLQGNTDSRGSEARNLALSRHRAEAVRDALVELGIPKDMIVIVANGSSRPAVLGNNEKAWAENRKVSAIIE